MNKLRGHVMHQVDGEWFFSDTGEATASTWKTRPCGHCGEHNTPEGHDACLGTLSGVMNACCGHGDVGDCYVQLENGCGLYRNEAKRKIDELKSLGG